MSVKQVADLKGITVQAVSKAIREDRLPALAVGNYYVVRREDALAWNEKRGRPRRPQSDGAG